MNFSVSLVKGSPRKSRALATLLLSTCIHSCVRDDSASMQGLIQPNSKGEGVHTEVIQSTLFLVYAFNIVTIHFSFSFFFPTIPI